MKKFIILLGLLYAPIASSAPMAFSSPLVFSATHLDEDDESSLNLHYSNRYAANGIVQADRSFSGLSFSVDSLYNPTYFKLGIQTGVDIAIADLTLAYSAELSGSRLLVGVFYEYKYNDNTAQTADSLLKVDDFEDFLDVLIATSVAELDNSSLDLFLSYSSRSYDGFFFGVGYAHDILIGGGLGFFKLGYEYAISDSTVIGTSIYSEANYGAINIDSRGFYHLNYSIFFQWNFLPSSGLDLSATWISPIRSARRQLVRDNVISFNLFFGL